MRQVSISGLLVFICSLALSQEQFTIVLCTSRVTVGDKQATRGMVVNPAGNEKLKVPNGERALVVASEGDAAEFSGTKTTSHCVRSAGCIDADGA